MGIWRPLVSKGLEITSAETKPSDKIVTPANAMTLARPILGLIAADKLIIGKKPVTNWIFFMAASDGEGNVGRIIDKILPNSGRGTTTVGADWDPIADTTALLISGSAAMFAPRLNRVSKAAIGLALGHEVYKAVWAVGKNREYKALTGERLPIKPTVEGKESMAEKFCAFGSAVLASDLENPTAKAMCTSMAVAWAIAGTLRAEGQRQIYDQIADQLIFDAQQAQPAT